MEGCEAVFHLAAITDARSGDDDAVYQVNFLGSENVFKLAQNNKTKIIVTSSAAVYGESRCSEERDCSPISQYGKSKLKAEKALQKLGGAFIVRIFNAYGPKSNSVVNKFCSKIPNYQEVTVFGHGLQTRDFIHVNDVVSALLLGLGNTGLYNVGTGKEISVLHLIDLIHDITKAKPAMKFTLPIEGDIRRSKAEIEKLKALGWNPKISLEDGVRSLLADGGWQPLQI
jgi:UDP-glucose 4-epimerase